jgi:hypothetical protein
MPEMKSTTAGPALTGGPAVGEGAHRADAIGVELAAEWLMLRADQVRQFIQIALGGLARAIDGCEAGTRVNRDINRPSR